MKLRLDALLVEKGLISGRDRAKAVIMAGDVYVNGQQVTKAGTPVEQSAEVTVRGAKIPYVSRGGLKLEKAVQEFSLELAGAICMDIGASTGGFTDVMLQQGASKVYAVDVGYGQLAWTLRQDARVVVMERTNIRYVTTKEVPDALDFASCDVSFISLGLVLPVAYELLKETGQIVCLIKPQFEAGKEKVGKRGVVRDPAVHIEVIDKVLAIAFRLGFAANGLSFSPITGPEGNIEYLLLLEKTRPKHPPEPPQIAVEDEVVRVVTQAHEQLVKQ